MHQVNCFNLNHYEMQNSNSKFKSLKLQIVYYKIVQSRVSLISGGKSTMLTLINKSKLISIINIQMTFLSRMQIQN